MKDKDILFGLHEMNGIGWKTIQRILEQVEQLQDLPGYAVKDWLRIGLSSKKAEMLAAHLSVDTIHKLLDKYDRANIHIISTFDEVYPRLLQECSYRPWILYCQGNLELFSAPSVAVVGTRTPTPYGKKISRGLSQSLASGGFTIVSGLARGIDGEAHTGALQEKSSTIAVLGGPLGHIYPANHRELYKRIVENGLIVSEYPLGTPSHPGLFPQRNRIIAGLTLGTLVVEAAERSGSLITAEYAAQESRDVFAVPGPITSVKSAGVLQLIQDGAKLVTKAEDIFEEYNRIVQITEDPYTKGARNNSPELTEDELSVMRWISPDPISFDEILERTQMDFGHLHSVLLSLTLKKQIEQLSGSLYSL